MARARKAKKASVKKRSMLAIKPKKKNVCEFC